MVDLETLGTGDCAPIVQVGAVLFSPWGSPSDFAAGAHDAAPGEGVVSAPGHEFEAKVELPTVVDPDTLRWWLVKAGRDAQLRVFSEDLDDREELKDVLEALDAWSKSWGAEPKYWWGACDFDTRLLRQHRARLGLQHLDPKYSSARDYRTLRMVGKLLGVEEPPFVGVKHDALDDAMHQALHAVRILRTINPIGEATTP